MQLERPAAATPLTCLECRCAHASDLLLARCCGRNVYCRACLARTYRFALRVACVRCGVEAVQSEYAPYDADAEDRGDEVWSMRSARARRQYTLHIGRRRRCLETLRRGRMLPPFMDEDAYLETTEEIIDGQLSQDRAARAQADARANALAQRLDDDAARLLGTGVGGGDGKDPLSAMLAGGFDFNADAERCRQEAASGWAFLFKE